MNITTKKFVVEDYAGLGQWLSPVLEYELWLDWANTPESKAMGIPQIPSPWISIDGHYFRIKKDAHAFIKEKALSEFRAGKYEFVRDILKKAQAISQECLDAVPGVKETLPFEEFLQYFDIMRRLRFPWMSSFPIDEAATEYIKEYAAAHSLQFDEILGSLPQLANSLTDDQKELLSIKQSIKTEGLTISIEEIEMKNLPLAARIRNYQKSTEYIGTHHMWGEERTIDRLMTAIDSAHESTQVNEKPLHASFHGYLFQDMGFQKKSEIF